jgi:hypothetical protein
MEIPGHQPPHSNTRSGSIVFGVGTDWDKAIGTVGPGQNLVHQYLATVGDTYWVQRQSSPTPTSGTTVTINDTTPTTDRYNLPLWKCCLPDGLEAVAPRLW